MENKIKHLSIFDSLDNQVILNFTHSDYDTKLKKTLLYDNDILVALVAGGIQFNGIDYYIKHRKTIKQLILNEVDTLTDFLLLLFFIFIGLLVCVSFLLFVLYMYKTYF